MDFPQFQVPFVGHGMIIGLNAVIHVFLSHGIAIGVVFFIALTELVGYLRKDEQWDAFGHYAVIPTAVTISSFSAITGVGIWFTIGTLAPRASSEMLRLFFWPWFLEWIVFFSEAVLILVYYLLWKKMRSRRAKLFHVGLGFSYVVGGLLSAWLITGIIGFQLTPGDWIWDQTFWSAFLNPSLWPQTFLRFFGGLAIGAILISGLVLLWNRWEDKEQESAFRRDALRIYGIGLLLFAVAAAVFFLVYFHNIPQTFRINAAFAILTSHFSQHVWVLWAALIVSIAFVALFALAALTGRRTLSAGLIFPAILGAFALTAGFERMREFIRGPYVMASYLYTSEWTAKETALLKTEGMGARLFWPDAGYPPLSRQQEGEKLFGHNCNTCHTIGGINDIRDRVRGRSLDGIAAIINHTSEMVPWMPPFAGNDRERRVLAEYLYNLARTDEPAAPSHLPSPGGSAR